MKRLKKIVVFSDGSVNFSNDIIKKKTFFMFQLNDDKNCNFYKKNKKNNISSKHLTSYKKKYLI